MWPTEHYKGICAESGYAHHRVSLAVIGHLHLRSPSFYTSLEFARFCTLCRDRYALFPPRGIFWLTEDANFAIMES